MGGRNPAYTQQGNKKYIKALMFIYWSGIKDLWINYWKKFLQNNNTNNCYHGYNQWCSFYYTKINPPLTKTSYYNNHCEIEK